jgi:hypothetical protein
VSAHEFFKERQPVHARHFDIQGQHIRLQSQHLFPRHDRVGSHADDL